MPTLIERAVLYDISRFARQFLHEQNVQDFHVTERKDGLDFLLKAGVVGDSARTTATVAVSADQDEVRIDVTERFFSDARALDEQMSDSVVLSIEGHETPGLLAWLRISIAGWLDAARSR